MKAETWMFVFCSVFFLLVTPLYWLSSGDLTGTTALVMTFLLVTLIAFYLGFHASKMDPRPEDRKDGEIAEGAGELGFFPPYSWWPLWCGLCLSAMVLGVAIGWWLFLIGAALGVIALSGLIFEYYRGEYAH
ncbi:cytochrome c oxidase subunit 4 [Nocardioides aurantiacus]|uniref:cytochrome c oxidase subunit 4 n=1 Tax=Nocardioides aurantiacus TaxID=86796 RepID=UPI00403F2DF8